ncbi:hypothetical protein [Intrasporangium sp. DVR]|uniref:hypothetical protein n=1 Tax=Intrasporangium sp. DVR TaxID=3127867 RepID=UPI00313A7380
MNHWSCGEFAPSSFTGDGTMVLGPNVADGAGASNWKVASAEDGSILLTVAAEVGAWAPMWRGAGTAEAIVLTPLSDRDTRQAITSCVVSTGECTTDLAPVPFSPADREAMQFPITLSVN